MIGIALFAAVLGGCTSTGFDDMFAAGSTAPQSAVPTATAAQRGTATKTPPTATALADVPVETVAVPPEGVEYEGPKDTGTFPNLNIKPGVANTQITDEEKAADMGALQAEQAAHAATIPTAGKDLANVADMRKLGATHAADALKKIQEQP